MSGVLRKRVAARADLVEIFVYLARRVGPVGHRFLEAAERTFQRILEQPGLGGSAEFDEAEFADLRFMPVQDFERYLVFYRETDAGIDIVRVLHSARDIEAQFRAPEP